MDVVLLDRDGTIIVDPDDFRVDSIDKIQLFPDTIEALKYLADHGFAAVIITNQAGIAEGRITEADFWRINDEVLKRIETSGLRILKTYMNGEGPGPNATPWRKPGPKMLIQAATDFNLDLSKTYMVGDKATDVQAAINAGCKGGVLVKTATGENVVSAAAAFVAPNLPDAAAYVVDHRDQ